MSYAVHKHNLHDMRGLGKRDYLLGRDTFAESGNKCDDCRAAYYTGQGDRYLQKHDGGRNEHQRIGTR